MIFVITFTVSIYKSPVHQLVNPEHILMSFHQLKKPTIINFKQTCCNNSSFLPVERGVTVFLQDAAPIADLGRAI